MIRFFSEPPHHQQSYSDWSTAANGQWEQQQRQAQHAANIQQTASSNLQHQAAHSVQQQQIQHQPDGIPHVEHKPILNPKKHVTKKNSKEVSFFL